MNARFYLGIASVAALSAMSFGQTLPEQATAAGIAGGLANKAAPSGLKAIKKTRTLKEKADARLMDIPNPGAQWHDPTAPAGAKSGALKAAPPEMGAQKAVALPTPPPPAVPWTWRLKGLATGQAGRVAVFESPDGKLVWARVGENIDGRSKVMKIDRHMAIVKVDKKPIDMRPW